MISTVGPEAVASRREAARALGAIPAPCELHSELFKLLRDQNPDVVQKALLSAGNIRAGEFLPLVIEKLGEPHLSGATMAALADYGAGAVGALEDRLNDSATPGCVRKRIPQVLARIGSATSADALGHSMIQSDPEIRYEVLKALNKLRARNPAVMPADLDVSNMFEF
jgi:HEAT repeat protein